MIEKKLKHSDIINDYYGFSTKGYFDFDFINDVHVLILFYSGNLHTIIDFLTNMAY